VCVCVRACARFIGAFATNSTTEMRLQTSPCLVCPSVGCNSLTAERIFIKLVIRWFYCSVRKTPDFRLNRTVVTSALCEYLHVSALDRLRVMLWNSLLVGHSALAATRGHPGGTPLTASSPIQTGGRQGHAKIALP
jgi:hypothetical protein